MGQHPAPFSSHPQPPSKRRCPPTFSSPAQRRARLVYGERDPQIPAVSGQIDARERTAPTTALLKVWCSIELGLPQFKSRTPSFLGLSSNSPLAFNHPSLPCLSPIPRQYDEEFHITKQRIQHQSAD